MSQNTQVSTLENFIETQPTIKYIPPSSPDYPAARQIFNKSRRDTPLAIVQPQSPSDVAALIKFAKSESIPFTLRTGGHNLEGRSVAEGALLIDLRALTDVTISADRKSATVQGGIILEELGAKLWAEGLCTPTGATASVGYVGWATYGGYGSFSSHWGLGVDQILGATVVTPDGEIVTADEILLEGIRGAGGLFGVIIDLTIKIYPLTNLLEGTILFDSTDIAKVFVEFNAAHQHLLETEDIPPELTLQQIAVNAPHGRFFGVKFTWSGSDIENGQRWSAKIASLAPVLMNAVAVTTIPAWFADSRAQVPDSLYGTSFTHNVKAITPAVAEVIGRNLARMPNDPGAMFSMHQLRGPSVGKQSHGSVFATREPHYMLELLGFSTKESLTEASGAWAARLFEDILHADLGNVLPTAYVSLSNSAQASSANEFIALSYGSEGEKVRELKKRFDPENLFRLTVPALE